MALTNTAGVLVRRDLGLRHVEGRPRGGTEQVDPCGNRFLFLKGLVLVLCSSGPRARHSLAPAQPLREVGQGGVAGPGGCTGTGWKGCGPWAFQRPRGRVSAPPVSALCFRDQTCFRDSLFFSRSLRPPEAQDPRAL